MRKSFLNGLTPAQFLHRYWQKKPLLARASLLRFAPLITHRDLLDLARSPDAESRLIIRTGGRWQVTHGPFTRRDFAQLPARNWTLLVQGVNHVLPQAQALLAEFAFIPYARLDDLMVSYAPPGGGVGPHFDSYDVFLLQGAGRRRWRISSQRDLALVDGAPLKILRNFRASREWELAAGDLLYLPPRCAHDGVAIEDCITYSIGFRAPSAQDLCARFLEFLQDGLDTHGFYADPQLKPTCHPARIDRQLSRGLLRLLEGARWNRSDMLRFLGMDLSTPKPHVVYVPPHRPLSPPAFAKAIVRHGLRLALPSILLYDTTAFYINGECWTVPARARTRIRQLADRRELPPATVAAAALDTLHAWYRAGYVVTD
ncbi:MAG: cupin domain-containing protein [Betaproteobacteria bacterium]|nr:MAG: cupin domain-containing protein [Betaproteobacteria bacterium]